MRGMSQQKLAEHLGLKRNNIASYEAGIVEPKAINFLRIALFFDISPSELLEKDVAASFLYPVQHSEAGEPYDEQKLLNQLHLFSSQTADMQKVLEGFREFQKLANFNGAAPSTEADHISNSLPPSEKGSLDNLLGIMEQLLHSNWKLIRSMVEEEDERTFGDNINP